MLIYSLTNKITGKRYIGLTTKSVNKRISEHISAETYVGRSLRKYGIQSFDISIIDSANTIKVLYEKEKYWIRFYDCRSPNGYNLTDGGDGRLGYRTTLKTKRLMSRNRKEELRGIRVLRKRLMKEYGVENSLRNIRINLGDPSKEVGPSEK